MIMIIILVLVLVLYIILCLCHFLSFFYCQHILPSGPNYPQLRHPLQGDTGAQSAT